MGFKIVHSNWIETHFLNNHQILGKGLFNFQEVGLNEWKAGKKNNLDGFETEKSIVKYLEIF